MATHTSALKRLFETGEHSDLTIVAAGKEFKVHQCVVSLKSDFFRAACTGVFKEAQTRRIELEEEDWVIQALLRYLYEQPYAPTMATEGCKDANIAAEIKRQIKIHKAADKYQILDFKQPATRASDLLDAIKSPQILTTSCVLFFNYEFPSHDDAKGRAAATTLCSYDKILKDELAWSTLYENRLYMRRVMEMQARYVREGLERDGREKVEPKKRRRKVDGVVVV